MMVLRTYVSLTLFSSVYRISTCIWFFFSCGTVGQLYFFPLNRTSTNSYIFLVWEEGIMFLIIDLI